MPYPPSPSMKAGENSLLRVPGGVLALLSILLTVLSIILHQGVFDLVFGIIVGIFALRILILWLGEKPQSQQQSIAMQSPVYPMRPPPYAPRHVGQPAPYAPQDGQQPVPYKTPYGQPQPFYETGTQAIAPPMPVQAVPPAQSASLPPHLPRSIRPQSNRAGDWRYGGDFVRQQRGDG